MKPFIQNLFGQNRLGEQTASRKNPSKNFPPRTGRAVSIVLVIFLLLGGLQSFTSCDLLGSKSEESLVGYWKSSYGDGFEIKWDASRGGYLYKQYDDANKTVSFAGIIMNDPDLTAPTGYIILRITDGGTWNKTVNYYYGVHWKDFTGKTVKQSSAFKVGGTKNDGVNTLQEAKAEYTVENGYFGFYGEYQRQ